MTAEKKQQIEPAAQSEMEKVQDVKAEAFATQNSFGSPTLSASSETDNQPASQDGQPHASTGQDSVTTAASGPNLYGYMEGWRLYCVQFCLGFGLMLSVMDSSIVSTALVTIANDFDDFLRINWIVLGYLLTYMGFSVLFARLSDVTGKKWAVVCAHVIFAAFSLGAALSQSLEALIAFRSLQGIGGSGLFSMTMVVLPQVTPPEKIGMLSGIIGAVFATSSVLGPIIGGVITHQTTWRWIFYINLPCSALVVPLLLIAWPNSKRMMATKKVPLSRVDFLGASLLLAASVLLVFALQQAGATVYAWGSAVIITTLTLSGVCWIALAAWMWFLYTRKQDSMFKIRPIIPAVMVKKRVLRSASICTFLVGFSYIMLIIQLPERFQIVNGSNSIMAGIRLLPLLLVSSIGSGLGGALSKKKNRTSYTTIAASCGILLGCGLLSTVSDGRSISAAQYVYQAIYGTGVGLTFSSATVMTNLEVDLIDIAVAQGVITQVRMFGGSVGVAIATIVFNIKANQELSGVLSPSELSGLRQSLNTILQLQPQQRLAVIGVFARSFNTQMVVCTCVAAACLIVSLFTYTRHPMTFEKLRERRAEFLKMQREGNKSDAV